MQQFGKTLLLSLVCLMLLVSLASAETTSEVTICHVSPGNPGSYETIAISASAMASHLAPGDFGGPCAPR